MIVIAVAALIIVLVLVAAPALQRNARNTQRRNDIGAIRGQLTTVFTNNNNTYPDNTTFDSDVLAQVEQAVYKDEDSETHPLLAAGTSSENKVYYVDVGRQIVGTTDANTDALVNTEIVKVIYPGPDELHIIVGIKCSLDVLTGSGTPAAGNLDVGDSNIYVAADVEIATLKTVAFIYQLEGETKPRCEDNA